MFLGRGIRALRASRRVCAVGVVLVLAVVCHCFGLPAADGAGLVMLAVFVVGVARAVLVRLGLGVRLKSLDCACPAVVGAVLVVAVCAPVVRLACGVRAERTGFAVFCVRAGFAAPGMLLGLGVPASRTAAAGVVAE